MSEEEIIKHLSRPAAPKAAPKTAIVPARMAPRRAHPPEPEAFKNFSATHLLCPRCRKAMPVKEKLLLFLADGDLYDYVCTKCGTSVGTRKAGR